MGIATGLVDTEALLPDEKVVDMEPEFKLLDPDESQFYTMTGQLPSKPAVREKVNWLEDQYFPRQATVAGGGYTNVAATFTVSAGQGAFFRSGDLVRNIRSGEMMEVSADPGADVVSINRAIGAVAAAAGNAGDDLIIVGNASAQGANYGTLKVTTRVLGFNYTQIFRNPFGFTGTEIEIETYGQGDPMNEIAKKAIEHKRAIESSLFLGARKFTSASPGSKGYMGGLVEFIATNVFSSIGTLTRATLDAKLQAILQHGSTNKVVFSAPTPAAALSGLLADNWVKVTDPKTRVYGAKVNGFISGAFGTNIPVIVKKEWGTFSTANNQLGSWMVVVDLDYIKRRPLRNRGTQLLRNRQLPGEDREVDEYRTEMSMEVAQESAHGILKGITG